MCEIWYLNEAEISQWYWEFKFLKIKIENVFSFNINEINKDIKWLFF